MTRRGITLPWQPVTDQLDTLRAGAITFLIGDTNLGKTTLMEQIALHCATKGIPMRGAMTEMSGKEIVMRMAARELRFDIADVLRLDWTKVNRDHGITDGREQLLEVYRRVKAGLTGVSFYDNKRPAARDVVADIHRWADKLGGREGLYVVDHLAQFFYEGGKTSETIREAIILIQEAGERRNLHLLFSHQVNRVGRRQMRELRFPELDWAEGSAGIEQMAHNVIVITNPLRDEYRESYKVTAEMVRNGQKRYEEVIMADRINLLCLKSRDLGVRDGLRGRGSIRQLIFCNGWYHTKRWLELKADHPDHPYDDSEKLPVPSTPGPQMGDWVGPFRRPEAA